MVIEGNGANLNQIIINKSNEKIDICVIEDGKLCEKYVHDADNKSILENIYSGVVVNTVDGMEAAFIDIGEKKNAFMPVKDALPKVDILKNELEIKPISEILKVGERVLVQVRKEPVSEKGARVSTHITLPGKYIILMPNTDIITVSQKIEDLNEKNKLKEFIKNNLPQNYGAIVRTDAINVDENELKSDLTELIKKWETIVKRYEKSTEMELLYNDHDLCNKIVRDLINSRTDKIICNCESICEEIKELSKGTIEIEFIKTENVFDTLGMISQIEDAEKRKIWLKCGGYIAIDKTEALTAIDVNSGKYVGRNDLEETALKVNEEAAAEIMRQIKLKDIGGIIVIDYIDMISKEYQNRVLEIMKKEAKKDRSKIDIKDFTKLNLVEMTRKKMYM